MSRLFFGPEVHVDQICEIESKSMRDIEWTNPYPKAEKRCHAYFLVQNQIGSNLCDQSNDAIILFNFSNYRVHANHQKSPKTPDFLTEFDMLISSIGNFRIEFVYE